LQTCSFTQCLLRFIFWSILQGQSTDINGLPSLLSDLTTQNSNTQFSNRQHPTEQKTQHINWEKLSGDKGNVSTYNIREKQRRPGVVPYYV
jgi:hypothetical protein